MVVTHRKSLRSPRGGRIRSARKKRLFEKGSEPALTKVGNRRTGTINGRGCTKKTKVFLTDIANVLDPKTKKYSKAKIKAVLENPANRHFIRRNIMTKGSVIDTEKGKAKVTSRPGQDGTVNAVLVA
jgi:small subunit ribosomal protein S8e